MHGVDQVAHDPRVMHATRETLSVVRQALWMRWLRDVENCDSITSIRCMLARYDRYGASRIDLHIVNTTTIKTDGVDDRGLRWISYIPGVDQIP